MSIFGLIICFFSFYLDFSSLEKLHESDIELNLALKREGFYQKLYGDELTIIKDRFDSRSNRVNEIKNLTNEMLQSLESEKRISKEKADRILKQVNDIEIETNEIRIEMDSQVDSVKKYYKFLEELETNTKEVTHNNNKIEARYERNYKISNSLLIFGTLLILSGFYLWYSKHQKYIDAEREWKGEIFVELLKEKELKDITGKDEKKENNFKDNPNTAI